MKQCCLGECQCFREPRMPSSWEEGGHQRLVLLTVCWGRWVLLGRRTPALSCLVLPETVLLYAKHTVCSGHTQISRCQNSSHFALNCLRGLLRRFVLPQTLDLLLGKSGVSVGTSEALTLPVGQWEIREKNTWLKWRPKFSQINPIFSSH